MQSVTLTIPDPSINYAGHERYFNEVIQPIGLAFMHLLPPNQCAIQFDFDNDLKHWVIEVKTKDNDGLYCQTG